MELAVSYFLLSGGVLFSLAGVFILSFLHFDDRVEHESAKTKILYTVAIVIWSCLMGAMGILTIINRLIVIQHFIGIWNIPGIIIVATAATIAAIVVGSIASGANYNERRKAIFSNILLTCLYPGFIFTIYFFILGIVSL